VDAVGIALGNDTELHVIGDHIAGIDQLAVDPTGERSLGQTGANIQRDIGNADGLLELALATIGKSYDRHGGFLMVWQQTCSVVTYTKGHVKKLKERQQNGRRSARPRISA